MTDQDGDRFTQANLEGKVWVANFIFTRCTMVCPRVTAETAALYARSEQALPDLEFVSFSVDPAYDTPEVLTRYAADQGADWTFLTGEADHVENLVMTGFKVAMQQVPDAPPGGSVLHGSHLVLVDADFNIRGYYDTYSDEAADRLLADARVLLRQR